VNEIKSFTFYRNYFDLLDNVKKEDKMILLEAIVDYVFKDIEPQLEGLNMAIWNNIKLPLDTSKSRASNGKIKKKSKQNQNKIKTKSKGVTNNISISSFYISISNLIINRLNELNNTKYKSTSEETLKLIKGRIDDGYTKEDLLTNNKRSINSRRHSQFLGGLDGQKRFFKSNEFFRSILRKRI